MSLFPQYIKSFKHGVHIVNARYIVLDSSLK